MNERTRNLLVGLTVLVGAALLAAMILIFQELPSFLQIGYKLNITASDASGIGVGSDVKMDGLRVGRVTKLEFTDGDPRKGVTFTVVIDSKVNIPGTVNGYIVSTGLMGGTMLSLNVDDKPPGSNRVDPKTGRALAWLPKNQVATLSATKVDSGLIPPDVLSDARDVVGSLKRLADTLSDFLTPPQQPTATGPGTASGPTTQPAYNIHVTMAKLDKALVTINTILGDPDNQRNIKESLANLNKAAAITAEAMKDARGLIEAARGTMNDFSKLSKDADQQIGDLARHLAGTADEVSRLLTSVQAAVAKIDSGEGTMGKLLNDPALYNNLLDTTGQLRGTIERLQDLMETWKKQGVGIHLK
jgi:phospholipid/cholesterol/gamma-HCH transport system substrate-binding protein